MSDYTPAPRRRPRGYVLAILDCVRAHLGTDEVAFRRALEEVHMQHGRPDLALKEAGLAVLASHRTGQSAACGRVEARQCVSRAEVGLGYPSTTTSQPGAL